MLRCGLVHLVSREMREGTEGVREMGEDEKGREVGGKMRRDGKREGG